MATLVWTKIEANHRQHADCSGRLTCPTVQHVENMLPRRKLQIARVTADQREGALEVVESTAGGAPEPDAMLAEDTSEAPECTAERGSSPDAASAFGVSAPPRREGEAAAPLLFLRTVMFASHRSLDGACDDSELDSSSIVLRSLHSSRVRAFLFSSWYRFSREHRNVIVGNGSISSVDMVAYFFVQ